MYVKGLFEVFKILGRLGIKPKDVIGMGGDIVKMGKSLFNTRINPKLITFIEKNQKIPTKILDDIKLHARTLKNATENQKNLFLENIKSIQNAKTGIKPEIVPKKGMFDNIFTKMHREVMGPPKVVKSSSPVTGVKQPATSVKELPEWTKGWKPTVIKGGKDGLATGGIANHFRERVGFADGPPGTIKKATGPTKKNVGSTSPVYNEATGHIYKRTNRWGTVYSNVDDTAAKKKGWEKRINKPKTVKGLEEVRAELLEKGKKVTQRNGKFIFADISEQAAFDNEIDKKYKSARASTGGKKAGVLTHAEIYEQFLKGYSKDGIHVLMARHKNANDLEYAKLSDEEKSAHKETRKDLLNKYQVKRISGTTSHPAHHLYSLGDEFDVRTKDIVIISQEVNARLGNNNRLLLAIAKERVNLLSDVNIFNAKNIDAELKAIDAKAEKVINGHYKEFPQDKGLLKYRKINAIIGADGSISFAKGNSIGGDSSRWINKDMGKDVAKLDKNELKVYRDYLLKKAKIEDLRMIEGVDTADKLKTEKTSSRTKPQIFARKILDKGQGVWKMLPGKNFRVMPSGALAATDFAISTLLGVPPEIAGLSASGWLTGKGELGKAISTQAQSASFMDEMNQKKTEDDRIENALAAHRLKKSQETAADIKPFKLDEKKEERLTGVDQYIINRHK